MKLRISRLAAVAILLSGFSTANAQLERYWDVTVPGTNPGFFVPDAYADGVWDDVATSWSTSALGDVATVPWNDAGGHIAVFRVGGASPNNADPPAIPTESDAIVDVNGARTAAGMIVDTGWVELDAGSTGTVALGGGNVRVNQGAILSINTNTRFTFTAGGGYLLDGGTLRGSWTSSVTSATPANIIVTNNGGTFYVPATTLLLNATAGLGSVLGVGGTTINGGAGTFIKTGPGELRMNGVSQASNTFAKLEVREGPFRLGNSAPNHETAYGAIPLSELADQITLNGTNATPGYIGMSAFHSSLHPNRGITIPDNAFGGNNGVGLITIPGPLTGSSLSTLVITGGGGFAFNNANNVNTFAGAFEMRGTGLVFINESLNAKNLFGAGTGTVQVAIGKSFTVGSDGTSTTYAGNVSGGAGAFTKVGTGTITMTDGILTGDVNVQAGTLQMAAGATRSADLGDRSTSLNISAGAILDMGGIVDIIGGITGAGTINNHNGTTAGTGGNTAVLADQMTLLGAKNYDFSGTINGSGAVIHSGVGTQIFSGANNYSGGTTVSNGKMVINNTSGSGTGTGNVTVSGSGILAGTGSIQGSVTLSGTSQLNTGKGSGVAEDLDVLGSVTQGAGTSLGLTLGDRLDVINTTNGLTLDAGGVLTILGKVEGVTAGTHTVVDYDGAIQGAAVASMPINNASGYDLTGLGVHDDAGSTSIRVQISGTVQDRDWSGGDGNWSYAPADTGNWTGGSGGQANGPGAIAEFNGGAGGTVTITDSNKTVGNLNLNSASGYTIAASGTNRLVTDAYGAATASITLAASSTHTISAPVTVDQKTNVTANGGTLNVTGGLINNAGIEHTGPGTLALATSNNTTATAIINHASIKNSGAGTLSITTNATGIVWNNGDGIIENTGAGNLDIVLNGTAAVIGLVNNGLIQNTSTGNLTITSPGASTSAIASSNAVNDQLTVGVSQAGRFLNTGTGTMTINATLNASAGLVFGGNITVNGAISPTSANNFGNFLGKGASVMIDGPGKVIFTAASTYSGRTTLKSGTLEISNDNQLGAIAHTIGGAPDHLIFDGGTLRTTNGSGDLTINSNRGITVASSGTWEAATVGNTIYAGSIHGGPSSTLTKTGTSQLNLTGQSISFEGDIIVSQGILDVNQTMALGNTNGNTTVVSGATLQTRGTATNAEAITLNGTGAGGIGALHNISGNKTLSGPITLGSSGVLIAATAGTVTVTGGISGAGNPNLTIDGDGRYNVNSVINIGTGTLTKKAAPTGTSTLQLGSANTIGAFNLNQGRIVLNNGAGFGQGTVTVDAGATAISAAVSLGTLTIANPITLNAGANPNLSPSTGTTHDFTGVISGPGALTRGVLGTGTGGGAVTLSAANTYAGGTTVSSGLMTLSGALATIGTGNLTVDPAGIFQILGTVGNGIADAATVNLNEDLGDFATMDLAAGINETVAALFLDGVDAGIGTFNSTTHPSYFMGTGNLIVGAPVGQAGDYNGDGDVDARDYVIWRKTNINGPAGYTAFYQNFGNYPPPGSGGGNGAGDGPVPEPTSLCLMLVGFAAMAVRRRQR